jgi:diguanylate cyclase (GGDEF)-like protein/PAS domain S-box-containing protein
MTTNALDVKPDEDTLSTGDHQGDTTRIGLLLADPVRTQELADIFTAANFVTNILSAKDLENPIISDNVIITDSICGKNHREALFKLKRQAEPIYAPILILLEGDSPATPWLKMGFDDVLRLPLSSTELHDQLAPFIRLRQHSEAVVSESIQRFRATFDLAPVGIVHLSIDGVFMRANPRFCEMIGYSEHELLTMTIVHLLHREDDAAILTTISSLLAGDTLVGNHTDTRLYREDQTVMWSSIAVSAVRDAKNTPKHLIVVIEDITDRKEMEHAALESERFNKATIDALNKRICVLDEKGRILAVNKAWRDFDISIGMANEATKWQGVNYLSTCDRASGNGADEIHKLSEGLRAVIRGEKEEFGLTYPTDRGTETLWFDVKVTRFGQEGPRRVVVAHEDITAAKNAEKHLSYLAHHDALTGLANRVMFYDRLKQAVLLAKRNRWIVCVLFIDLDHFKIVNDTLGHNMGDKVLKLATKRIQECLRTSDIIGRLGSDEFGIALPNLRSALDAGLVAEKIKFSLASPFNLDGAEITISASIGIALSPLENYDADSLISGADTAMYRAKELGRNNFQYFTDQMNDSVVQRVKLENDLRKALERKELFLRYQPQVDINTREVLGVEALIRWQHPERGLISPGVFIPLAEESGLIVEIGEWVMRTACAQNKAWQDAGLHPIVVAVNLSARQFKNLKLTDVVKNVLRDTGLEGQYLELELTEGIVMENTELLIETMYDLKKMGVRLSLDDFGTGYSNLAYLTRFPLDIIKIDRSFVMSIGKNGDKGLIASTVITLAHSLSLKVIAEGVETEEQQNFLIEHDCDCIQGYLFSPPMAPKELAKLISPKDGPPAPTNT